MSAPTIDGAKDNRLFCPSQPVIDMRTGDRTGWWYGVHIIPEGYKETTCWRCGVALKTDANVIETGKDI